MGTDGLPLIAYVASGGVPVPILRPTMAHCANAACSALTRPPAAGTAPAAEAPQGGYEFARRPSLVIGADGLALVSYGRFSFFDPPTDVRERRLLHCANAACTSFDSETVIPITSSDAETTPLAMSPSGEPWFARPQNFKIRLGECSDTACLAWSETCAVIPGGAGALALARGADGQPLTAFYATGGGDLGVVHGFGPCLPSVVSVSDVQMLEGDDMTFARARVSVDTPSDVLATVDFTTVDGTALAGSDYYGVAGTFTFGGGYREVGLTSMGGVIDEPDEQYTIVLSNPQGLTIGDGTGVVTLVDDDPPPGVTIGGCNLVEGTGGSSDCTFQVSLSLESGKDIAVGYATQDETASAGSDYTAATGVLSFPPGTTSLARPVSVSGDSTVENDETFRLDLGSPVNATILEGQAQAVILDDDAPSLSSLELTHGSTLSADLGAQPGPVADVDFYRLAQPPLTSWEVQVDGVSGDVAPGLVLERLAADNATVLQTATAVGAGGAVSVRFENRLAAQVVSQHLRVRSGGCGSDCGRDDVYRVRVAETTARLARFNNNLGQVTILLLQNRTAVPVQASVDFWDEAGGRLATRSAALPPFGVLVLDTSTIAALAMASGSVTVTNDAPYGGLAGKAVALEPGTGFTFDSPLEYRPR
jgi:hypothetical protein